MTVNLPAVRGIETPTTVVARRDTDSWADMLPHVVDLARSICGTDFVPEALRNNIPATAAAILYGREIGLPPMTALGGVNVIKGKPGLYAVIMRSQVFADGHELREDECNNARCTMSGKRKNTDYWQSVTYTFEDAKRAGLLAQNKNYEKNPRRMLRARATSELCELMFPDVVRGMSSIEELEEIEDDDTAGRPVTAAPGRTTTTVQRRKRTTKSGTAGSQGAAVPDDGPAPGGSTPPTPGPVAAGPSSPPPPLPGEPGYDGASEPAKGTQTDTGPAGRLGPVSKGGTPSGDSGVSPTPPASDGFVPAQCSLTEPHEQHTHTSFDDDVTYLCRGIEDVHLPEPDAEPDPVLVDSPRPASKAILRALMGSFRTLGYGDDDRDARLAAVEAIIGRPITSMQQEKTDLSHDEARKVGTVLSRVKSREQLTDLLTAAAEAEETQP